MAANGGTDPRSHGGGGGGDGAGAGRFHSLLWRLSQEHDREVRALRAELACWRAEGGRSLAECGDGDDDGGLSPRPLWAAGGPGTAAATAADDGDDVEGGLGGGGGEDREAHTAAVAWTKVLASEVWHAAPLAPPAPPPAVAALEDEDNCQDNCQADPLRPDVFHDRAADEDQHSTTSAFSSGRRRRPGGGGIFAEAPDPRASADVENPLPATITAAAHGSEGGEDAVSMSSPMRSLVLGGGRGTHRPSVVEKTMFVDANEMKERIRRAAIRPEYNVANFYHKEGIWQGIALHPLFERATLSIIAFNALWIWIDTDENDADLIVEADAIFQIMEYSFCVFFSFEWTCRFNSFARKCNCFKDFWFVFDSFLVLFMVLETWVMTAVLFVVGGSGLGSNLAIMRLARLLRLSRMTRMVRLFRAVPELLILIKGMKAAMRSVLFTLCLLAIIVYVFGIAFTQMVGRELEAQFGTVPISMHTLLLDGTLLDGTGIVIRRLAELSFVYVIVFYIFILLAALTVMNMLIGVLCEVVSAVAATEKESIHVAFMKGQLERVWAEVTGQEDTSLGVISRREFSMILGSADACKALKDAGVDAIGLVDNIDFIFEGEVEDDDGNLKDKTLSFGDFVSLLLTLRGSNNATVKDIVDLRKYLNTLIGKLREDVRPRRTTMRTNTSLFSLKPSTIPPRSSATCSEVPMPSSATFSEAPTRCSVDFGEVERTLV